MNIAIIGHFGGEESFSDGQTVKTITLFDAMSRRKPADVQIHKVDTYYIKRSPLRFAFSLFRSLCRDKKIVVLLSKNGRKKLFPILYLFAKLFKKDIYHYAIGGQLGKEVATRKKWSKYLNSFRGNWLESHGLVSQLRSNGINNSIYIPNFKTIEALKEDGLVYSSEPPFHLCTFSRVMPEKGIEDAIKAVSEINQQYHQSMVRLDIYGPIEKGYEVRFDQLISDSPWVNYCGVVAPSKSVETLKEYFLLLFPTYWIGEGMPGTIIDAYSAGVPVIARWWPVCEELVDDGVTGFVYPQDQPERLVPTILHAIQNVNETNNLKKACIQKVLLYGEDAVMNQISEAMQVSFKCNIGG